jgi:hypothetical protein
LTKSYFNTTVYSHKQSNGSFQKRSTLPPRRKFLPSRGGGKTKLFLIIVNVLGHPKGVGGLTSNFLCGGGMDVFWNDPITLIPLRWASPSNCVYMKNSHGPVIQDLGSVEAGSRLGELGSHINTKRNLVGNNNKGGILSKPCQLG